MDPQELADSNSAYFWVNNWWPRASAGCVWGYTWSRTFPCHWGSRILPSWWGAVGRTEWFLARWALAVDWWSLSWADQSTLGSSLASCQLTASDRFCRMGTGWSCAWVASSCIRGRRSDHMVKTMAFCHYDCMVWSRCRTQIWNPFFLKSLFLYRLTILYPTLCLFNFNLLILIF